MINMNWGNKMRFFRFSINEKQAVFQIVFNEILPKEFLDHEKKMFHKKPIYFQDGTKKDSFCYSYAIKPQKKYNNFAFLEEKQIFNNRDYNISQPRVAYLNEPKHILIGTLNNILQYKKIIFYTGAGLSVASGIPSMDQLETKIGIKNGEFIESIRKILKDPYQALKQIIIFHKACFFSSPSLAHWKIKEIALKKNCLIFTENLDFMHELTGIYPYRIKPQRIIKEVTCEHLKQIEFVICIGLSHDDRGFLNWYKTHNSNGKIISINYNKPLYLDDNDYWIQEDLQEVFQKLQIK